MTFAASKRIQSVQRPLIPIVGQWIAEHPGTISLAQGVAHYQPPQTIAEASFLADSAAELHRYGAAAGQAELLQLLATKLEQENAIDLKNRVLYCTAGANMAFINAVLAIVDVGEEVILPTPFYFNHEMAIEMAGCNVICVPTKSDYQLDIEAIEKAITPRTRAVVTVSPNNPTGAVYCERVLVELNRLCLERNIYHIHDETYEYFVYGDSRHFSPASCDGSEENTIAIYSMSKAYSMAGWRVGYMVVPAHLDMAIKKVQDTNLICPPIVCQHAARAALHAGKSWCEASKAAIVRNRTIVCDALAGLDDRFRFIEPQGAFYVLLSCTGSLTDVDLVREVIAQYGVATLPGSAFGIKDACVLRISFGGLAEDGVVAGMKRLNKGLSQLV